MHHVWNHHHHHACALCQAAKEASINFIISFLVSFDVDINTLHSSGAVIKKFVFLWTCTLNPCMQSLQGLLPNQADTQPTMLRGGLKFTRPPTPPPCSRLQPGILHWNVKLLTHLYQSGKVSAHKQMIPPNKSKGFFFFCWICMLLQPSDSS